MKGAERIYVYPEFTHSCTERGKGDVEYIRADIVEEMRRAMVAYMERFPSVFGAPYREVFDYKEAIKLLGEE